MIEIEGVNILDGGMNDDRKTLDLSSFLKPSANEDESIP